ncbi:MAG: PAS domain S-box protein, partial [Candidatus Marinimicrobia bacterium]|nr:PAS domain S-box protein [Candidatus Neomarinimicrobiota bacterium]
MKILIVDDKEENLYLLDSLLKGCGYEVVSAVNGFDALEKLRSDNFNMIISDILMPVMDGYSLLKKVRADNKIKDIPFVFYTATYTDGQDEELALDLGVDKYIRKPIEPEEFINIIKGVIIDAEKGKKRPPTPTLKDEKEVLKLYSERLVKKLEKKMLDLEEEVAERKSLEEKLIAERDEFHSILQELPVGVAVLDAEDKFVYINSITIKIDGYKVDPDSLIGKNVKSIHSKHILSIIEDVLKDFKSGKKSHFSREAKRGKRLIEISYHAIRNGAGEYQGLTRLVSDITEKKLSEKKLRESLEYSQNLIDSSLDMIIAVDIKRQITEFNQSAEDTFGYKREEVLGKHINMLYADVKQGLKVHKKVVEKGRHLQEIANKRKNGDIFPTLLAASTLINPEGELIGVMGVSRDITKRKKVEEEREQALQEAQNANEVKNLFLANMSHEIRTPLNTILGFTGLIEESTRHIIGEEEKKF